MQSGYKNYEDTAAPGSHLAGKRPAWMNQKTSLSKTIFIWGGVVVVLVIAFVAGFFITVPDVATFRAELKASRRIETVSFNTKAVFDTSLVSQGENIGQGDVIGAIATTAHPKSVFLLEGMLAGINLKSSATATEEIKKLKDIPVSDLGELQADYNWLIGTIDTGVNQATILTGLKGDLTWLKFSRLLLEQQKKLLMRGEVRGSFLDVNYQDDAGADPVVDINTTGKQNPVMDLSQYKILVNSLKTDNVTIKKLDFTILANKLLYNSMNIRLEELEAGRTGVVSAVKALQRRIAQWKQYCLLTSPIDGQLEYAFTFDSVNSNEIKLPVARVKQAPSAYYFNAIAGSSDYEQLHVGQDVKLTFQDTKNGGYSLIDAVIDNIEPGNNKASSYNVRITAKVSSINSDNVLRVTNAEQEGLVANASVVTGYKNLWTHLWEWFTNDPSSSNGGFSWSAKR